MVVININSGNAQDYIETAEDGERFLVLGTPLPESPRERRRAVGHRRRKIRRQSAKPTKYVWGTLGMEHVGELTWSGQLKYSGTGNEHSKPDKSMPVTCEQIELIREVHPEAVHQNLPVRERFIDLSDVQIEPIAKLFDPDHLPSLRLTIMLEKDEGAIAYLQLYPNQRPAKTQQYRNEVDLEYLQPLPTPGHRCDNRDRLTYRVPLLTAKPIKSKSDGSLRYGTNAIREHFVVKILTFKRAPERDAANLLQRLHYHIWGHTHQLLFWNPDTGNMDVIDHSTLRSDRKTLFLIHGTASSTDMAFNGLLNNGTQYDISPLHARNGGPYGQIIGFNHPTFSEDAEMNAAAFFDRLPCGFEFRVGMDIITHSRGGLLGKYLALYHNGTMHIERGVLVACANGVGYFTVGHRLSKYLSSLRAMTSFKPALRWLIALVQLSGDFLMRQPGAQLMTPGNARLEAVLKAPEGPRPPQFLPIVGNFSKNLVAQHRFFRRMTERGLDLVIRAMLGRQHDWVVGTKEQYILPAKCYPKQPTKWKRGNPLPSHIHSCRHSDYFSDKIGTVNNPAPKRIQKYLLTGKAW